MEWDWEINGIEEGLTEWNKSSKIVVLTDFESAIATIIKAEKIGKAIREERRKVIRRMQEVTTIVKSNAVRLGWIKWHNGIKANAEADKRTNLLVKKKILYA